MNNLETIQKVQKYEKRITELFEQKFSKADWEAKKPDALKWAKKCRAIAYKEMFA